MKKQLFKLTFIIISSVQLLHSYVEVEADGRSAAEVTFSDKAFNRISYKEGEVKSVVGNKNDIDVNINSGIAFIKPKPGVLGPLTVTVITSDDEAQDLTISIQDKAAEHVRLIEPKEDSERLLEKIAAVNFLNELIEGRIPQSYKVNNSYEYHNFDLAEPLESNFVKCYEGPSEYVCIYRISNNSRNKDFVLNPALLKTTQHLWVFLTNPHLGPKESSLCLVSIPRQGVFE